MMEKAWWQEHEVGISYCVASLEVEREQEAGWWHTSSSQTLIFEGFLQPYQTARSTMYQVFQHMNLWETFHIQFSTQTKVRVEFCIFKQTSSPWWREMFHEIALSLSLIAQTFIYDLNLYGYLPHCWSVIWFLDPNNLYCNK